MGCCGTTSKVVEASSARRRLTVGCEDETGGAKEVEDFQEAPEDRSLLLELNKQQIVDMISAYAEGEQAGKRFSLSSQTDRALNLINSFGSKETSVHGSPVDISRECVGYACKKGLKPEAPNQDSFFICKAEGQFAIYGVFDGHGRKGHDISNFVKDHLPKVLVSREEILDDPVTALTGAFSRTQKLIEHATNMQAIDASRSGTTASVVLHDVKKNILYIAHVGDSRVVLAKTEAGSNDEKLQAIDLTEDHKPDLPAERTRIEESGGQIIFDGGYNYRVYAKGKRYPGLNMSRAMGDLAGFYDAGISAAPDVAAHHVGKSNNHPHLEGTIDPHSPKHQNGECKAAAVMGTAPAVPAAPTPSSPEMDEEKILTSETSGTCSSHSIDPECDKFLLICSDGVWEFVSSKEAVEAVSKFRPDQAMEAAEYLAQMSWDRWMHYTRGETVDDITAVIVHLSGNLPPAVASMP